MMMRRRTRMWRGHHGGRQGRQRAGAAACASVCVVATTVVVLACCIVELAPVEAIPCEALFPSMYCCVTPEQNPVTFQPVGCRRNNTVLVDCFARQGVECDGIMGTSSPTPSNNSVVCDDRWYSRDDVAFQQTRECFFVDEDNIYDLDTALALSIFFGMFGLDRFYLGYPALGLAKMLTLGGFFVGQPRRR
ncbi:Gp39 [Salpingoeca rosetta]|uniref:Gp39 n=1 Tax=Salpingoeca rosetta (strain ATCC 50818 / BSB-021) TaxID=946362 RepID=F2U2G4_SALR5|nr:Gp39 [Salpingoeca rosetta]EGD81816.1 Gp39 [Salpingoeca rosetta]|eukprot:XP_004997020.1 Gp39 [Salpingoeca rosetta]